MTSTRAHWSRIGKAIFVVAFLGGAAFAQTQGPVRLAPQNEPKPGGMLVDAAQVGAARIVMGVALNPDVPFDRAADVLDIHTQVPRTWRDGRLCVRLLSPDALYEGLAEYVVTSKVTGQPTILEFPGEREHWETLRERNNDELALAVTRGRCADATDEFLIASLEPLADTDEGRTILVFVNGQDASRVFAETKSGNEKRAPVPCKRAGERGGVGFDRVCEINVAGEVSDSGIAVTINRISYGAPERPVKFSIYTDKLQ